MNCVSKSFTLSQLSNDDLFWKDHYKKFVKEFYAPTNLHFNFHYNQNKTNEIKQEIAVFLQSTTHDYKNEIIKFIKEIIENTQIIQKERLSKMKYKKDKILQNKEFLLQNASTIMKNHKLKECDCKMVAVGDGFVGKTCMLMVLCGIIPNCKNLDYTPTVMDNTNMFVSFNNNLSKKYSIGLWDIGGQESYDRLRPLSYPYTVLKYCRWVPEIQYHCPDTPFIFCGTKVDLRENKKILFHLLQRNNSSEYVPISKEEGDALAKKIGAIAYIETSSMERVGFDHLGEFILLLSKVGKLKLEEDRIKKKCLIQ